MLDRPRTRHKWRRSRGNYLIPISNSISIYLLKLQCLLARCRIGGGRVSRRLLIPLVPKGQCASEPHQESCPKTTKTLGFFPSRRKGNSFYSLRVSWRTTVFGRFFLKSILSVPKGSPRGREAQCVQLTSTVHACEQPFVSVYVVGFECLFATFTSGVWDVGTRHCLPASKVVGAFSAAREKGFTRVNWRMTIIITYLVLIYIDINYWYDTSSYVTNFHLLQYG